MARCRSTFPPSTTRASGALVSIDAIATNATIVTAIQKVGADYLLAVKANQPTLRAEVEACFAAARPGTVDTHVEHDKGHGRIEQRTTSVMREVDWLSGERRFPGELRLPGVACIVRVQAQVQRGATPHTESRYSISSATLDAARAHQAVRGHWAEVVKVPPACRWNTTGGHREQPALGGTGKGSACGARGMPVEGLDVTFGDDQSWLREGFGAKNMAVVRHFALNLVRSAKDKKSIKLRRKLAGWTPDYLNQLLSQPAA